LYWICAYSFQRRKQRKKAVQQLFCERFTQEQIRRKIEAKKECEWEFLFLGPILMREERLRFRHTCNEILVANSYTSDEEYQKKCQD